MTKEEFTLADLLNQRFDAFEQTQKTINDEIKASVKDIKPYCDKVIALSERVEIHDKSIDTLFNRAWAFIFLGFSSFVGMIVAIYPKIVAMLIAIRKDF